MMQCTGLAHRALAEFRAMTRVPVRPEPEQQQQDVTPPGSAPKPEETGASAPAKEIGGRPGPDPTRYGDWEKNGRCIDF